MPSPSGVTAFNLLPPALRRTIHDAYDDTMEILEARRGTHRWPSYNTIRMTVARHIVERATHGECNAQRLRDSALTAVHLDSRA